METINLTRLDGISIEATLICYFENINDKKQYLYYTLNEINGTDANSTVKIYCAKMRQNDPALDEAISESTWEKLKGHMAEALKETLNPEIKFLPISSLVDKTIVSEKVIAMPVSYDYVNKHYKFYIDNISGDSAVLTPTPEAMPVEPAIAPETPTEITPESTVIEETPVKNTQANNVDAPAATPIDIASIEAKYAKMIEDINSLKEQELEAAKRYNATIELSSMHNEQHASYVQSEQIKEAPVEAPAPFEPTPVEPAPIEPIVQEPAAPSAPQDIETNWFDMPIQ